MIKSWVRVAPCTGDCPLQHQLVHPLHSEPLHMRQPVRPCSIVPPSSQLHLDHPHTATVLYPQVNRPPAQGVEVELELEVGAVGEDDVEPAVQPGRARQRPLHKVQVARVARLEGTAGAHDLSRELTTVDHQAEIHDWLGSPLPLLCQAPGLTRWSTCIGAGATRPVAEKSPPAKITTSRCHC